MHPEQNNIEDIKTNLNSSFREFYFYALEIIKELDKEGNYLKFAIVNMQIALELFLKYYFLQKGKHDLVFNPKNTLTFRDFTQIINLFYTRENKLLVTDKKNLKSILNARNKIVHEGQDLSPEENIKSLINTALFIQNVLNREFQETLLKTSLAPGDDMMQNNLTWKTGAEDFARNIAKLNNEKVYECWFCYSKAFLNKKIFSCDELDDEGFQCTVCLNTLYLNDQIGLTICNCGDKTFVLDCLNPQRGNRYHGKCLQCDFEHFAFKCPECEEFFIDFKNMGTNYTQLKHACHLDLSNDDSTLDSW